MGCRKINRLIEEYLDGSLSAPQSRRVEAHVRRCAACAAGLAESRQLAGLLRDAASYQVSPGFEARLESRRQETTAHSPLRSWWERFQLSAAWRARRPAYATALAGAILVAVVFLPRFFPAPNEQPGPGLAPTVSVETYIEDYRLFSQLGELDTADYELLEVTEGVNYGETFIE